MNRGDITKIDLVNKIIDPRELFFYDRIGFNLFIIFSCNCENQVEQQRKNMLEFIVNKKNNNLPKEEIERKIKLICKKKKEYHKEFTEYKTKQKESTFFLNLNSKQKDNFLTNTKAIFFHKILQKEAKLLACLPKELYIVRSMFEYLMMYCKNKYIEKLLQSNYLNNDNNKLFLNNDEKHDNEVIHTTVALQDALNKIDYTLNNHIEHDMI